MNHRSQKSQGRPIVEVKDFTAAYGNHVVLRDVNFSIREGEIFVIAGGSGCGKSTVLKHLIGLYEPAAGKMLIDGEDIHAAADAGLKQIRRKFGVAYQGNALFGSMTILENVKLPMEEFTELESQMMDMIALSKLRMVNLESAASKAPSELSGGMQKRAAVARAIALDPRIVFLDEPSAGLDPITSAEFDQLILKLNRLQKMTFVIVTHELASIFTIADRVLVLDAAVKTMVGLDSPVQLRDHSPNPWVRSFFNREASDAESRSGA
jgi:phospholipid/cholesterol/gamma-HCH transport system ATP-binding protein